MMPQPTQEVAERVLLYIEEEGRVSGTPLPISVFDPGSVRLWVRDVVGDIDLADALGSAERDPATLLMERRAQCGQVLSAAKVAS